MRVKQRRMNTVAANRTIALVTMAMMLASIFSVTALATNGDATYIPEVETVDGYITNDLESSADAVLGGEETLNLEVNEPNSPALNEDVEVPDGNTHNNEEDLLYEDYANELTGEYGDVEIEAFTEFIVTDWDGLYDVFTNLMTTDGPYAVEVVSSITMEAQLNIPVGRTVYLGGGGVLYQPTANARHFGVGGTLVLNDITLSGMGADIRNLINHGGVFVNTNGKLIVNAGSVIKNNFAIWGGGVHNNGRFTMNGGEVRRNFANDPWFIAAGGGVYNSGVFIMNDGLISANNSQIDGGGVYNSSGEFIMNGGSISDNGAQDNGDGVFVRSGTFTMHDGEISRNTSRFSRGAGVSISSTGAFIMHSGEISRNTSVFGGGGVRNSGQFTMYGGSISENRSLNGNLWMAPGIGGGVENSGHFTMNGGIISGNTANSNSPVVGIVAYGVGGGVYNGTNGTFTMNNGTITGNNANIGGGINNAGTFLMRGGTINGNIAREDAESVWWDGNVRIGVRFVDFGTPSMTGGYISNSTDVEVMVVYGTQVSIGAVPILERFGYNFAGWLLGDELLTSVEVADIIMSESTTLVAQWIRSPNYWLTVTFAPGTQGTFTEQVFTDILYGTASPAFVGIPTGNNGWSFTGWSPEITETVTTTVTYVAQWEEIGQTTPDPQYRTIHIYYYLEGYGNLVNDTANNVIGREYVREVDTEFSLAHVIDRNELDSDNSDNDYVFEGWRVYVDGIYDDTYISDLNVNQLRGSFTVPTSTSDEIGIIRLVAVWSIYEAQDGGDGNDGSSNDNDNDTVAPGSMGGSQQKRLPQTGVESMMLLWSALLVLIMLVGIDAIAKIRRLKAR